MHLLLLLLANLIWAELKSPSIGPSDSIEKSSSVWDDFSKVKFVSDKKNNKRYCPKANIYDVNNEHHHIHIYDKSDTDGNFSGKQMNFFLDQYEYREKEVTSTSYPDGKTKVCKIGSESSCFEQSSLITCTKTMKEICKNQPISIFKDSLSIEKKNNVLTVTVKEDPNHESGHPLECIYTGIIK